MSTNLTSTRVSSATMEDNPAQDVDARQKPACCKLAREATFDTCPPICI